MKAVCLWCGSARYYRSISSGVLYRCSGCGNLSFADELKWLARDGRTENKGWRTLTHREVVARAELDELRYMRSVSTDHEAHELGRKIEALNEELRYHDVG